MTVLSWYLRWVPASMSTIERLVCGSDVSIVILTYGVKLLEAFLFRFVYEDKDQDICEDIETTELSKRMYCKVVIWLLARKVRRVR
jgi:hypothetical protein